ncbi:sugar ABC transporter permease [Thermoclostridium stercorarium subsp. leptospartum DSM 9219]|uniref:Sugar ABC transporter permease n=1 Tax=Thermoclostridium stercorarium subsp. leptospartum DSM 9219 TaxID=1346611 RepID=A0A1B1YL59_THEST|nr:carbohydrate ABC transporter permease [Thermoclostridium stercorarium]ANX01501.1 sugar ABC transporter permease [Thermoclostridium stercorarium subsp. leptospartum DSM 9219]
MTVRNKVYRVIIHIFLIIGSFIMIMPFVWMVLTSFKSVTEATQMNPFVFFPTKWRIENYLDVIKQNNFLRLYYNTLSMIFWRVVCAVAFSSMAGYAFARLNFPGRDFCFGIVLFQMMIPTQVFIIPQYLMVDKLGARNTIFALVFPGLVSAFGTFLLRQFFKSIPVELEQAARIDGCNIGQTFVLIMLPLVRSGMVALSIFTALFAFKDLMWPLIVNSSPDYATLASALAKIQSAYSVKYNILMAASVLAIWPMILIYFIFQRQFMQSVTTSGLTM